MLCHEACHAARELALATACSHAHGETPNCAGDAGGPASLHGRYLQAPPRATRRSGAAEQPTWKLTPAVPLGMAALRLVTRLAWLTLPPTASESSLIYKPIFACTGRSSSSARRRTITYVGSMVVWEAKKAGARAALTVALPTRGCVCAQCSRAADTQALPRREAASRRRKQPGCGRRCHAGPPKRPLDGHAPTWRLSTDHWSL